MVEIHAGFQVNDNDSIKDAQDSQHGNSYHMRDSLYAKQDALKDYFQRRPPTKGFQ